MSDDSHMTSGDGSKHGPKYHAPKDRKCPFCGVAFTSSSLGRHLDQFIKERNPKAPDSVHNVDEIKRMRGNITRRHPRNSLRGRRETLTPAGTPTPRTMSATREPEQRSLRPSVADNEAANAIFSKPPFAPGWEFTGVMRDIPDGIATRGAVESPTRNRRVTGAAQRLASRQVAQKTQLDTRQKLEENMDVARAAELALLELMGSWRAAKEQISPNSKPFDFDPLTLDFPALILQCLQPPPTLFSSTQYPTPSSWSIQAPGAREFEGLRAFFKKGFREWRVKCAAATTYSLEESSFPLGPLREIKEDVKKSAKLAEDQEKQVNEHLQSCYAVWESLPAHRRDELWMLEMARSVGRRHKEVAALKDQQSLLKQRIEHLLSQIDSLNRLQQPREFNIVPPHTIPIDPAIINLFLEKSVTEPRTGIGFDIDGRHEDIGTIVSRSIERWKAVIVSKRAATNKMRSQRPLPDLTAGPGIEPSHAAPKPPIPPPHGNARAKPDQQYPLKLLQPAQSSDDGQSPIEPPRMSPQKRRSVANHHNSTTLEQALPLATGASVSEEPDQDEMETDDADTEDNTPAGEVRDVNTMNLVPQQRFDAAVAMDEDDQEEGGGGEEEEDEEGDDDSDADADADAEEDEDEDADGDADADGDEDEDGDAEMEDEMGFNMMAAQPPEVQQMPSQQLLHQMQQHIPQQQHNMLHVPRTRGPMRNAEAYTHRQGGLGGLAMMRSMPNMNAAAMQHGIALPGVKQDDGLMNKGNW